jgi:predicted MFS family arabinose efflux permease
MYPAWASLMSEYLPESRRASYFGRRGRLLAAWGLATLVLWGFALDGAGPLRSGAAFALVFGAGALCRLVSTRWMADLKPLPDHEPPILPASPWRQRLRGPLGRLTLYAAVASASTQLCDALLAAHMLGDLHFGYRRYMLVRLAWCVGQTATASAWGRLADSRGPARLLRVAGFSLVLAPLVWALTDRLWLVAAFELLDGAAAAGFSLCAANHLYDAVPAESRLRAVGLYNLWCGVAIFAGAGLGASLAARGAPLHALFGAAAALRLLAELVLGRRVREVRTGAPKTSRLDLLFGLGLGFERLFAPALAARQPE